MFQLLEGNTVIWREKMTRMGLKASGYSRQTKRKERISLALPEQNPTPQPEPSYDMSRLSEGAIAGNINGKVLRTAHCDRCHKIGLL
jgi:hypothetical protein